MRNLKKHFLAYGILAALVGIGAYSAGIKQDFATDNVEFGLGANSDDKSLTVDVGDGPTNPKITVDETDKDFDFSSSVTVSGNDFGLGDGAASNKTITFDRGGSNPIIRWNEVGSELEFSNDGITFQAIGSGDGSGGGNFQNVQLVENADAEIDILNWTASGGAFTRETASPLNGSGSFSWDASAASQTLRSDAVTIPTRLESGRCFARVYYQTTASDYTLRVVNGSNVAVDNADFEPLSATAGDVKAAETTFDCPASGDLKIEFTSGSDAAAIVFDDAIIGQSGQRFSDVPIVPAGDASKENGPFAFGAAAFATTGGITFNSGDFISSVTNPSTGQAEVTFTSDLFASAPVCVCSARQSGRRCNIAENIATTTATTVRIFRDDTAGSGADGDVYLICFGISGQ